MSTPRVSIIMPSFNAEIYIADAIRSMQAQTLRDFELIIVDDGSTDQTAAAAEAFSKADPRIKIFQEPKKGLAAVLNRGITLSQAPYIARMDADDISLPHRIEKQVLFLDMHKDIAAAGTWADTFGTAAKETIRHPTAPEFVAATLPFKNCIVHGSVMMRRETLARERLAYDQTFRHAEDYGLWARLALKNKLANLAEVLVHCRIHDRQAATQHQPQQLRSANQARGILLAALGITPNAEQAKLHVDLAESHYAPTMEFIRAVDNWLRQLLAANESRKLFDRTALAKVMAQRWAAACLHAADADWEVWKVYWGSSLAEYVDRTQERHRAIPNP